MVRTMSRSAKRLDRTQNEAIQIIQTLTEVEKLLIKAINEEDK
jgi:hypothetical protein